jgi:YesN/AraC family two-component response regulator
MANILVSDDEEMVHEVLRMALQLAGHEVMQAANGEEGVHSYRQTPVDLVITDLRMSPKDGLEVIRELKRDFSEV